MKLNILESYLKDLKPTAEENYIYTLNDDFFGKIIFSKNSMCVNMIQLSEISDEYLNKVFSINCIKNGIDGFSTWFGVMDSPTYTYQWVARQALNSAVETIKQFKQEMRCASYIGKKCLINEDPEFYNNILIRKSFEGAGRYIFRDNVIGDRAMYIAPCMLPGSKSTPLDCVLYNLDGMTYSTVSFISHKKTNDVITMFRILNV